MRYLTLASLAAVSLDTYATFLTFPYFPPLIMIVFSSTIISEEEVSGKYCSFLFVEICSFYFNSYKGVIKGFALAVPVLFLCVTAYITGSLIKKQVGLMKTLVIVGLILTVTALGLLPIFENIYLFFAAISVTGIGAGLVLPCLNMLITSATAAEERGMITSLYGSVRFFGVAFGPPAFSLLMDFDPQIMFWSATAVATVAATITFFFIDVKAIQKT